MGGKKKAIAYTTALSCSIQWHGPDFALLTDGLGPLHGVTDLDAIDLGGAIRRLTKNSLRDTP